MTSPGFGPTGVNPLDSIARGVAHGAQSLIANIPPPKPLTPVEKREAHDAVKAGAACRFCACIHAGASTPACPRLAGGKLNGDGDVIEFTFWRDDEWPKDRLVRLEDIDEEEESHDGDHDNA